MSAVSRIEWTDTTWNPVVGCAKVSEGCRNCYAMKEAHRLAGNPNAKVAAAYEGLTRNVRGKGPQWTGRVRCLPDRLRQPLRWRKPRRVFVNSMSDLFHPDVPTGFVAQVFAVMASAHQHVFQVLTKRPDRMARLLSDGGFWVRVYLHGMAQRWSAEDLARIDETGPDHPLPNVWLGTSVENQEAADERIPHLLRTPAAVRWLSCEPLLGPVDLLDLVVEDGRPGEWHVNALHCDVDAEDDEPFHGATVDWVVVGGESGRGARPFDLDWGRSLVRQCRLWDVPVFVKQLGSLPRMGVPFQANEIRDKKGGDPSEWPEDLRVREWPR